MTAKIEGMATLVISTDTLFDIIGEWLEDSWPFNDMVAVNILPSGADAFEICFNEKPKEENKQ